MIGGLSTLVPAALAGAGVPSESVPVADDTGTFSMTLPAAWSEVWTDPSTDEAGALYPRILAAPAGGQADFEAPGVVLNSWPGSPAVTPDPANLGRGVPEGCTEVTPVGPAPLTTLPNAIAGTWACGDVTFTSLQGNTADGTYLVALSLRVPTGDTPVTILESLTYAGGTGPAALPPVETVGLTIENPGDPSRTVRLRVERSVDQVSTLTHDVTRVVTGAASNAGLDTELSQDRSDTIHLVGSTRITEATPDGAYSVVVTPTELTSTGQTADGTTTDEFAPLIGLPIVRWFGPDGQYISSDAVDETTVTDEQRAVLYGLPVDSISLPATAVGVGATWSAPATFTIGPVTATAPAQYRLDALDGDRFTVSVTMDVDLATVERDIYTESNTGRFTRSVVITGSLTQRQRPDDHSNRVGPVGQRRAGDGDGLRPRDVLEQHLGRSPVRVRREASGHHVSQCTTLLSGSRFASLKSVPMV